MPKFRKSGKILTNLVTLHKDLRINSASIAALQKSFYYRTYIFRKVLPCFGQNIGNLWNHRCLEEKRLYCYTTILLNRWQYPPESSSKTPPVWPDWAKFCHLCKLSKLFSKYLRVYLVLDKISNILGKNYTFWAKLRHWKKPENIKSIWSHWTQLGAYGLHVLWPDHHINNCIVIALLG